MKQRIKVLSNLIQYYRSKKLILVAESCEQEKAELESKINRSSIDD